MAMPFSDLREVQELQRKVSHDHNVTFVDIVPHTDLVEPYVRDRFHKQYIVSFEYGRLFFFGLCIELGLCK